MGTVSATGSGWNPAAELAAESRMDAAYVARRAEMGCDICGLDHNGQHIAPCPRW
jgi:hypothetical protein